MDIYNVIKRPLVTEKGTHQATQSHDETHSRPARGGSYAFEVHRDATKPQIREAIEKIYNVKVQSVRTANRKGKARRVKFKIGQTADWKKAVVVLHSEHHIDLF
ncbi:MAG: 50S ribosomal protein L23 [Planctomycetes bacterium]|nr:50S ribosomal protein L23 [Planctomycetota bacterium]MBI3836008.1 50S ribosomal protein L23 [Planctomycetota bacterium]